MVELAPLRGSIERLVKGMLSGGRGGKPAQPPAGTDQMVAARDLRAPQVAAEEVASPDAASPDVASPDDASPDLAATELMTLALTNLVEPAADVVADLSSARAGVKPPARERYDRLVAHELAEHSIRVRKWRRSMSGVAFQMLTRDGRVLRVIESPRPAGPMSAAIFLHEIGHHAIGFSRYKPRCLEEFHAWAWALAAMERHAVPVTEDVQRRVDMSLRYALAKALRRGLRKVPAEMMKYVPVQSQQRAQSIK